MDETFASSTKRDSKGPDSALELVKVNINFDAVSIPEAIVRIQCLKGQKRELFYFCNFRWDLTSLDELVWIHLTP